MDAEELARRIFHLDRLARVHVGRGITIRSRHRPNAGIEYTLTRPLGAGIHLVAQGDYDQVVDQLTLTDHARLMPGSPVRGI